MAQSSLAEHTGVWEQLQAIRSNNEAALKHLYTSNYHKVEHFVLNNNGTSEQAKDVFQEAFIASWRNIQLGKFQPRDGVALDAYLFQIAKNKWMDHLRSGYHSKVVRMSSASTPELVTESSPEENEYLQAVKKHFKALGDNCKKLLTLFYYENESLRHIANQMGWTEATAKNNKYRCIQKLKELINKQA